MKTKIFRKITLLFIVLMLVCTPILSACGEKKADDATTPDESETVDLSTKYTDKDGNYIAETARDDWSSIGTITFLTCGVNPVPDYSEIVYNTIDADSTTSLPLVINEDIKLRNSILEERLGITVNEEYLHDNRRYGGAMLSRIRLDNMSGAEDYEVVVPCMYDGATLSLEGEVHDLLKLAEQGLQIEAPWWNQEFNENMTMGGQLYVTIGDLGLINKEATAALYFNLDFWNRLNLTDKYGGTPYDLVREGKWTVDLVFETVRLVGRDLNDDGIVNVEDEYGWGGQLADMSSLYFGGGQRIATAGMTDDGYPMLTMYNSAAATLMEKMQNFVKDSEHYVCGDDYFGYKGYQWPMVLIQAGFSEGRVLYYNASVGTVTQLGGMEEHFGIVPVPKATEIQDGYHSLIGAWSANCFAIPIGNTGTRLQMTIDALNVLGAASANTVAKDYSEIVLQWQKTRDDDSVDMLFNYILPNRSVDIGIVYSWGGLNGLLPKMASNPVGTFASNYEALETAAQFALDETIEVYRERAKLSN